MPIDDAQLLADDPRALFGTARAMFAVPYDEIRELQLAAMRYRFESLRPQVQLLDRLAQRHGVDRIDSLADGARLLYPSNVYKSYPFGWLVDQEYGRLTNWLRQLTAHDLSSVDVTGVDSLDEWFTRLEAATDLRVLPFVVDLREAVVRPSRGRGVDTAIRVARRSDTKRPGPTTGPSTSRWRASRSSAPSTARDTARS